MSKEAKKKTPKKVVPASSTRSGLVQLCFFRKGNFLSKRKIDHKFLHSKFALILFSI